MYSLELVLTVSVALTEIVSFEWVVFELRTQVSRQTPTTFRKEIQLIVRWTRPLSDQLLSVDFSAVFLNFQHVTTFLHSNVRTQLTHECYWCQGRDELLFAVRRHTGSSSTKKRITPFTPTIPAGKSRTRDTLANPIPPQVAIMLLGVTSTGTKPQRLRSRSHHHRAAEAPTTSCCAPVSVKPRAGPQNQTSKSVKFRFAIGILWFRLVIGCIPIGLVFELVWAPVQRFRHERKRHVGRQVVQRCKRATWHKKTFRWCLRVILRCLILTFSRQVSELLTSVTTGTLPEFGSCDTFSAVFLRFLSVWSTDISISSRFSLCKHCFTQPSRQNAMTRVCNSRVQ